MPPVYAPPAFKANSFTCLHCHTLTSMYWGEVGTSINGRYMDLPYYLCICGHCNGRSLWHEDPKTLNQGYIIFPASISVPEAHENLPPDCLDDFDEAREICERSPRGAAALLRLCLQKLLKHLGGKGEHIDTDIKALVATGLDKHVQQALDVIRVTGNNAVHPLEMNLEDDPDSVLVLFEMINFIVEERISRPLKTQSRFANLPEKARLAIEKRDKPKV
ncbi:DUF4145 domain-containing protein [Pseudomonas sp. SWRI111]|nr:DUF4145 domain-containing protein [Pseudomonas sp. SWRI111]